MIDCPKQKRVKVSARQALPYTLFIYFIFAARATYSSQEYNKNLDIKSLLDKKTKIPGIYCLFFYI
jgi:hypothetical protein